MTCDFSDKFHIAYTVLRKSTPAGKVFFSCKSQVWKFFCRLKKQNPTYAQKTTTGGSSTAWENSRISRRHGWFPCEMMSEERAQKFHTDDVSLPRSSRCFWLVMQRGKSASTNQKHHLDQGSDRSSVWNFCTRFSDVISRGNQWWRREMSAVFSAYSFSC